MHSCLCNQNELWYLSITKICRLAYNDISYRNYMYNDMLLTLGLNMVLEIFWALPLGNISIRTTRRVRDKSLHLQYWAACVALLVPFSSCIWKGCIPLFSKPSMMTFSNMVISTVRWLVHSIHCLIKPSISDCTGKKKVSNRACIGLLLFN